MYVPALMVMTIRSFKHEPFLLGVGVEWGRGLVHVLYGTCDLSVLNGIGKAVHYFQCSSFGGGLYNFTGQLKHLNKYL